MIKRLALVLLLTLTAAPAFAQANLSADLAAARTHYPASNLSPAQLAALLNEVAWQHRAEGWGLLAKPSGNNCPAPGGAAVSCDFLVHLPSGRGFDVLTDSEGAARVQWGGGEDFDRARFVPPTQPAGGAPEPPPGPVEPQPGPTASTVIERVTALQSRTEDVLQALQAQDRKIDALVHQLELMAVALEQAKAGIVFPVYRATIFGQKVTLTPAR